MAKKLLQLLLLLPPVYLAWWHACLLVVHVGLYGMPMSWSSYAGYVTGRLIGLSAIPLAAAGLTGISLLLLAVCVADERGESCGPSQ